jgi:23S rRNA pseudouridine2605 synthase
MAIRIAKAIADSGTASRRGAEELISLGLVRVNGNVVDTPVFFVEEDDVIEVNGKKIKQKNGLQLYMFHKPINTMTTTSDPQGRKTIYDCLPVEYKNLKYIGRLDFKTTGLLLLTNDGELARKLTLPSSKIPRTYIATVSCKDFSGLDAARKGITVYGIRYSPMKIDLIGGNNLRVSICEGKKNEVRIVLAACGCPVHKLHRVSFGNIKLKKLSVGKIEPVPQKTIDELLKSL